MNPDLVIAELRNNLDHVEGEQTFLEREQLGISIEIDNLLGRLKNEKSDLYGALKLLRHNFPDMVPEMDMVDPRGGQGFKVVPDPQEVIGSIQEKTHKFQDQTIACENELGRANAELATLKVKIRDAEENLKSLSEEKIVRECKLRDYICKSAVLQEIDQKEKQLEELIARQEAAEQAKANEEVIFREWLEKHQAKLTLLRQQKDEIYVLTSIEKAAIKTRADSVRNVLIEFQNKLKFEFKYAVASCELSNDNQFPFFLARGS